MIKLLLCYLFIGGDPIYLIKTPNLIAFAITKNDTTFITVQDNTTVIDGLVQTRTANFVVERIIPTETGITFHMYDKQKLIIPNKTYKLGLLIENYNGSVIYTIYDKDGVMVTGDEEFFEPLIEGLK